MNGIETGVLGGAIRKIEGERNVVLVRYRVSVVGGRTENLGTIEVSCWGSCTSALTARRAPLTQHHFILMVLRYPAAHRLSK